MPLDLTVCDAAIRQDPVLYLDLTEAVRRGIGHVVDACPTGALVAFDYNTQPDQDTGFTMFALDEETAQRLAAQLPPDPNLITVHEQLSLPILERQFGLERGHSCFQLGWLSSTPLPIPDFGLTVRPLSPDHLGQVCAHYQLGSSSYMEWLLAHGMLYGAFRENILTGFIGRHAEGSMGLLEVFPAYRRQGIAGLLQRWLTNLELSQGHTPYGQVFTDNAPSLALQRSLGFQASNGVLYWATKESSSP